jgi:hypothetical protein
MWRRFSHVQRQVVDEPPIVITSERKTGVKHAEVITARLLQTSVDGLRLAN